MAEDLRRLFEQGGDDTPVLTRRVAWGLAGTATKNSTWQTIVTWLQSVLNFLKPASNLSDVLDPATALSNIGGIGASALNGYALKSNVLELNNTVEFTPDNDYEPATKKYIDDIANSSTEITQTLTTSGIDLNVLCITNQRLRMVQLQIRFNTDGFDGIRSVQMSSSTAPFPKTGIFIPAVTGSTENAIVFISTSGLINVVGLTTSTEDYIAFATYFY